ncbi:MAG: Trm112 family protein [Streptosporangiales bacterium]|nr:Trm112 family protein [Streptosporangiales bacterium]
MATLEPWVLELLACPACKSPLRAAGDAEELGCTNDACGLVYPVRDGVPVLLVDEARRP